MADYNSNYTGQEIDEAVEKTLSEVPEYWIPLDFSGGVVSVPADKESEVGIALYNPDLFNILGCKFTGGGVITGHRINESVFSCPFTEDIARERFGISCPASLVVRLIAGGNVTVEVVPDVFIVTLTPTAQDFSGTMDKLPSEISNAFNNGHRIVFSIPSMSASVEATQFVGGSVACANITYDISGQDVLIQIVTSASDSTYSTKIFPLTPMS